MHSHFGGADGQPGPPLSFLAQVGLDLGAADGVEARAAALLILGLVEVESSGPLLLVV